MLKSFTPQAITTHLSHPCFSRKPSARQRLIAIPHKSDNRRLLECIHAPVENSTSPPVLFIHGAFHAAWCFGLLQDYLQERGIESFAVSLRNHGNSWRSSGYDAVTLTTLSRDVEDAVRHLFIRNGKLIPYILVGHSMGGAVGGVPPAALLLLFSFSPIGPQTTWLSNWYHRHHLATIGSIIGMRPKTIFDSPNLVRDAFFHQGTPNEIVDKIYSLMEEDEALFSMLDLTVKNVFKGGREAAVRVATHPDSPLQNRIGVFCASEDKIINEKVWTETSQVYHTTPVIIEGVGHDGFLDMEYEKIGSEIFSWLEEKTESIKGRA
ncbi:hypothetical protein PROFUN_04989 [Planoprotostelium fungivorum]|uniref:AB hydrolase-1 domain-containing protein n=1 Tax=Planoprotostelium fungivorum TaxID=1890364 RepID=A0A2P6NSR4_9EUKA|nr:hypothetical protein PROFUN_04989 [Planoprotostelium fungivorum]